MNDHDLLIKLSAQMETLTKAVENLQTGTKQDITNLQNKVDVLEKANIELKNAALVQNTAQIDRCVSLEARILALENQGKAQNTKSESNKAYIWRKILEYAVPFIFIVVGLVLAKLGILNLN